MPINNKELDVFLVYDLEPGPREIDSSSRVPKPPRSRAGVLSGVHFGYRPESDFSFRWLLKWKTRQTPEKGKTGSTAQEPQLGKRGY